MNQIITRSLIKSNRIMLSEPSTPLKKAATSGNKENNMKNELSKDIFFCPETKVDEDPGLRQPHTFRIGSTNRFHHTLTARTEILVFHGLGLLVNIYTMVVNFIQ